MARSGLALLVRKLLRGSRHFSFVVFLLGISLGLADPISVALHARWYPDLTFQTPRYKCVTSGAVAGSVSFHIVANYSAPVDSFFVDSFDIVEQTDVHKPQQYHSDGPLSGNISSSPPYDVCSSPPTGYKTWAVCQLDVPISTFSFHNTSYLVSVNYHYDTAPGHYLPSRVYGSTRITINFGNLIVSSQPEYLIIHPGESDHNTTIKLRLSSAQRKYCKATISIYSLNEQLVKQETLNNILCPGVYTYTWDGKGNRNSFSNRVLGAGLYIYDVSVQGACPDDCDTRYSPYLKVKATGLSILDFDEQTTSAKISYLLEDSSGKAAKHTEIRFFHPQMKLISQVSGGTTTNLPDAANPIWNIVHLDFPTGDSWGGWRALIIPLDDHSDLYKNHQPKPAFPKNSHLPSLPGTVSPITCQGHRR